MRTILLWSQAAPVFAGLLLLGSCSTNDASNFDLLEKLPVPQGAYEVQKIHLGNLQRNQQLFFKIDREYPAMDVLHLYSEHFIAVQWIPCRSPREGWDWFLDKSFDSPRYVHQIARYWISKDRQMVAMVNGLYYSNKLSTTKYPDNSVQRWVVLMQKDLDVTSETRRLSLRCEPQ